MTAKAKKIQMCDPYVWEDPRYLFRHVWFGTPKASCASELVNQTIFVYAAAALLGSLISSLTSYSVFWLSILIGTIYLVPTFLKLHAIQQFRLETTRDDPITKEGFAEKKGDATRASFQNETLPGVRNPFGNVTIDELPDGHTVPNLAPYRKAAPDITATQKKVDLDAFFRVNWYNDPTDVFGKTQSQRMFVTNPSTTIPNDQASYQNWLYKIPGKTCKEGNPAACYGGTEGSLIPWLNND